MTVIVGLVEGREVFIGGDSAGIAGGHEYDYWCVDLDNLREYTGLKDKNGVEIYEGDIVTWSDERLGLRCVQLVENINSTGGFSYIEADEVIGNAWENPELLEPVKC